jgi:hypothetical protein
MVQYESFSFHIPYFSSLPVFFVLLNLLIIYSLPLPVSSVFTSAKSVTVLCPTIETFEPLTLALWCALGLPAVADRLQC